MDDTEPRTLKTVDITCSVLNALKEVDGATVTELSKVLELSKGAVYNHLATLRKERFVRKTNGQYKISHRFHNFGEEVKYRSEIYNAAKEEVDRLVETTEESVNLMVEEFGKGIYLYKRIGEKGIADEYHNTLLRDTDHLHWSSTGKAILAQLDDTHIEHIIQEHGLPAATDNTITSKEELFEDIEKIRNRDGIALNDEEEVRGTRAVGAPIVDGGGNVLGAISISGPISRITDEKFYDEYPTIISQSSNIIEVTCETM
ncbi:IclR family transcriptional regulator [Halorussus marinus]|uniref:IclR family transcriptional regulator n=1 Tax=Halorussus marinus TaxID=2505976 RepID=UPI001092D56B|nr:IclR family transcriptional regulator [Halorussus marinus]